MNEFLTRGDIQTIGSKCAALMRGNRTSDVSLEDEVALEFGEMARYWALPFVFEMMDDGKRIVEVADMLFVDGKETVSQDDIVRVFAEVKGINAEEDEEVSNVKAKVEVKDSAKPKTLTDSVREIYSRLVKENANIKNAEAQRAIGRELGVIDDKKKMNSIRAAVVRVKKELAQ